MAKKAPVDPFEAIAKDTIEKAADVKCDAETYRAGLRYIRDEIDTALDAAKND